jgi:DNA-binding transcriptional MerR regulator
MAQDRGNLLKIGELARLAGVLSSTVHFYTKEGLLKFADETQGGYRLYDKRLALSRIKEIQLLQNRKRLTIKELKKKYRGV